VLRTELGFASSPISEDAFVDVVESRYTAPA
jgi:hypothetical protein